MRFVLWEDRDCIRNLGGFFFGGGVKIFYDKFLELGMWFSVRVFVWYI